MKKHVGRPTNEEVKRRKIKKAITVFLPVAAIVIVGIAVVSSGSLSKLMGNSVTEYYCEDSSYTLEGMECTKLIREKANLIGDINLDGRVDIQDQTEFQKYQAGTLVFNEKQEKVADINEDGAINANDMTMLQEYLGGDSGESTVGNPYSYVGKKFVCLDGYNLNGEYCEKKDIKKALAKTIDNPVEVTITDDKNGNTNITSGTKVTLDVKFKVNHASKKYYYMLKTYENDKQITQSDCLEVKEQTMKQDLNLSEGKEIKGIYTIYSNASCNVVVDRIETKAYKLNTSSNTTTNNQTSNTPTTTNKTFTIKYKANGGTGSMSDQIVTYGNKVSLSKNKFTRSNYAFNGWRIYNETKKQWSCYLNSEKSKYYYSDESYCKKYGYVVYKDQQNVAETGQPGETLTFYAQWTNQFTIQYNANGGTGSMSNQKIKYGTQTALKKNAFKRTGYGFNGWYAYNTNRKQWNCYKDANKTKQGYSDAATCKKYGYVRYSDGVRVAYTGNPGETVTLYAQWYQGNPLSISIGKNVSSKLSKGTVVNVGIKIHANEKTKQYYYLWRTYTNGANTHTSTCEKVVSDKNIVKTLTINGTRKGTITIYSDNKCSKKVSNVPVANTTTYTCTNCTTSSSSSSSKKSNSSSSSSNKSSSSSSSSSSETCKKYESKCKSGYAPTKIGGEYFCQKQTGTVYYCDSPYEIVGGGPTAYCQKAITEKYCKTGYKEIPGAGVCQKKGSCSSTAGTYKCSLNSKRYSSKSSCQLSCVETISKSTKTSYQTTKIKTRAKYDSYKLVPTCVSYK